MAKPKERPPFPKGSWIVDPKRRAIDGKSFIQGRVEKVGAKDLYVFWETGEKKKYSFSYASSFFEVRK